ncbi:hypothetical protein LINPERHAP1_LOCUS33503 [Linum perenne]
MRLQKGWRGTRIWGSFGSSGMRKLVCKKFCQKGFWRGSRGEGWWWKDGLHRERSCGARGLEGL